MINRHFVSHFLKHYWSATRIDVLHSPFVFELYNACIARESNTHITYSNIESIRLEATRNRQKLVQLDMGAKGEEQPIRIKTVSYFAKQHAKPARIAQIIHRIVKKYKYQYAIELGTSLGFTSMYIADALPDQAKFITIEGAPEIAEIAQSHMQILAPRCNVDFRVGNFNKCLPEILSEIPQVDVAFIDGNHTYEATMRYFELLLEKVTHNTVLIFDDIYWSPGMTKAWNEIKHHPRVNVTVDLFYIGLVYFRTEQVEEHFKLRIW
jgi:predicted O-methyltransferase YrrM